MLKQWLFTLKKYSHQLSVRAALFAFLAVTSSLVSVFFASYVPDRFSDLIGGKAVDGILSIMASSMLIVTTFAMSNMVAAYSAATQSSPPRATKLIKDDSKTHSAISIFLGAFIYSIVSLIALSTAYYGEKGRVILLLITILVLLAVVWVMIKWVDQLRNMSSVSDTILRVEKVTSLAFRQRAESPTFECNYTADIPKNLASVRSKSVGFIQNIDIDLLGETAKKHGLEFFIANDIGSFVNFQTNIIYVRGGKIDSDLSKVLLEAFSIGKERTFESDPLYGISVLSSIGIKAMSPSLNDPGTAIDATASMVRIILEWDNDMLEVKDETVKYNMIYFPKIRAEDVLHQGFSYLARQSVSSLQVIESLKEALLILEKANSKEIQNEAKNQLEALNSLISTNISLPRQK